MAFKSSLASMALTATALPPSLSCARNKTKPWVLAGKGEGTGDGAVCPSGWEHLGRTGRWRRVVQGGVSLCLRASLGKGGRALQRDVSWGVMQSWRSSDISAPLKYRQRNINASVLFSLSWRTIQIGMCRHFQARDLGLISCIVV